jgi:hypothetical protein
VIIIPQSHDEAVSLALSLKERISTQQVTNNFIASLSSGELIYRSGLPALAIMQTFPNHTFIHTKDFGPDYMCSTCISSNKNPSYQTKEWMVEGFKDTGGLISYGDIYMYCTLLMLQEDFPPLEPCESDYDILFQIIQTIENLPQDATPSTAQKLLKPIKGFRSNEEQRRTLLETFGYCGILQTEKHQGSLYKFTRLGLAPSKRHTSNWTYPVDWWTGESGINRTALNFWFPNLDGFGG